MGMGMSMGIGRHFAFLILAVLCVSGPALGEEIQAVTKPSKDVTLSFVRPGRIAKVLVREGEVVKAGQLLAQQDDAAEQAQLAQLKAQAEDITRTKASEAQLAQKKVELKRIEWAAERGGATELEVEQARLDVLISELSLVLTKFQREQDNRKYQEAKIQVARMRLASPIAGKVEAVRAEAGESVDALAEVVRVVDIDPLWIEVPVPLKQAKSLKRGRLVRIGHGDGDDGKKNAATGRIIHIASVADAASDTLNVKVELANPSGRPAGQRVHVSLPPPRADVADTKTKPAGASDPGADKKE